MRENVAVDSCHEQATLLAEPYHDPWPRTYCCAYACALLGLAVTALAMLC